MKNIKLISAFALFITLGLGIMVSSCNKEFTNPTYENVDPNIPTNITIKMLKDSLPGTGDAQKVINSDLVFSGIVVSSDATGNFYKEIHVQQDSTAGIRIAIDAYELHNDFPIGKKIYVKCKGLTLFRKNGMVSLGQGYGYGITSPNIDKYIVKATSGNAIPIKTYRIDELATGSTVSSLKTTTLGISLQSMLIKIENVQMKPQDTLRTYANVAFKDSWDFTNPPLVTDCAENIIILLNSGYADFAGKMMPSKNGTITAVMTFYGSVTTNADPQLIVSSDKDLNFTNSRCARVISPVLGGASISYSGSFTENFESYTVSTKDFPMYLNYPDLGAKYWELKSFGTPANKYIQMSSFGSGGTSTDNTVYFMVPVDFTAANTLTFKANAGYYNGAALKVHTLTGFTPGTMLNPANLNNISSNFTLPTGPTSGYGTFASAGTYNFPAALTGNGFIVFEYSGAATGTTTTIQIDDVVVN